MGISLDCHGQSPRNDAVDRVTPLSDVGILLYTRKPRVAETRARHPEERSDVGISLDCHGQSPRNDAVD